MSYGQKLSERLRLLRIQWINLAPIQERIIENLIDQAAEMERALRTEVAPRTMPDPPPSMNYLEREAWKLGWYNAIYEKDPRGAWPPFPTGDEPQDGER